MGAETLKHGDGVEISDNKNTEALQKDIGATVFEALATQNDSEENTSKSIEEFDFRNSVTRYPDGQTVPDER